MSEVIRESIRRDLMEKVSRQDFEVYKNLAASPPVSISMIEDVLSILTKEKHRTEIPKKLKLNRTKTTTSVDKDIFFAMYAKYMPTDMEEITAKIKLGGKTVMCDLPVYLSICALVATGVSKNEETVRACKELAMQLLSLTKDHDFITTNMMVEKLDQQREKVVVKYASWIKECLNR